MITEHFGTAELFDAIRAKKLRADKSLRDHGSGRTHQMPHWSRKSLQALGSPALAADLRSWLGCQGLPHGANQANQANQATSANQARTARKAHGPIRCSHGTLRVLRSLKDLPGQPRGAGVGMMVNIIRARRRGPACDGRYRSSLWATPLRLDAFSLTFIDIIVYSR
jgi:hypothetical protein